MSADDLMTLEEYKEAARVLAKLLNRIANSDMDIVFRDPDDLDALDLAEKVLSQMPRGIADKARADSKRRNEG